MTIDAFVDAIVPLLLVVLIIVFIVIGAYLVIILMRIKKVLERLEVLSDVSGWFKLIRKLPFRKKSK